MSNVRSYIVNDVEVWQGISSASGFRTRLFLNREDAEAEEKWLDNRWHMMRGLFELDALRGESEMEEALWHAFRQLLRGCGRGCYLLNIPVGITPPQGYEDVEAWEAWSVAEAADEGTARPGRYASWVDAKGFEQFVSVHESPAPLSAFLRSAGLLTPPTSDALPDGTAQKI